MLENDMGKGSGDPATLLPQGPQLRTRHLVLATHLLDDQLGITAHRQCMSGLHCLCHVLQPAEKPRVLCLVVGVVAADEIRIRPDLVSVGIRNKRARTGDPRVATAAAVEIQGPGGPGMRGTCLHLFLYKEHRNHESILDSAKPFRKTLQGGFRDGKKLNQNGRYNNAPILVMNTDADIDTLCQSMDLLTVAAPAVPPKKRITKTKKPDPAETPSETVSVQETPAKKRRAASKPKTPKNLAPLTTSPVEPVNPVFETVSNSLQGVSHAIVAQAPTTAFRWHNYTLDYERILQSFFVADGRYVGLADVGGKVEPVFFVACSSNWSSQGELPVVFVHSTTFVDEASVDHFEPCWERPLGDGMLTVAAMYNCMPYDAKRDYVRA